MSGKRSPDVEQVSVLVDVEAKEEKGVHIQEAVELYGDEEVARAYGFVARG